MNEKDGGPAFPVPHGIDGNWQRVPKLEYSGMTLRDWFAAHVLAGMHMRVLHDSGLATPQQRARLAYIDADAMLKAREATNA